MILRGCPSWKEKREPRSLQESRSGSTGTMFGMFEPWIIFLLLLVAPFVALQLYILAWIAGPALRRAGRRLGEGLEDGRQCYRQKIGLPPDALAASPSSPPAPSASAPSASAPATIQDGQPVYTYQAPGMPPCEHCGKLPAIFHCSPHAMSLCLQCVSAHDRPQECSYIPSWRAEKVTRPSGQARQKAGSIFGL